jgi:hypothetical protein
VCGAAVLPGDAVVADEAIARAEGIVEKENYERELVRTKQHRFRDVYRSTASSRSSSRRAGGTSRDATYS